MYPDVFLEVQHGFDHATIATIALIDNAGAVIGGPLRTLSQRLGRRVTIVLAAPLSLPVLPFGNTALTLADRRFPDANLCPKCQGRHSIPSQRTVTRKHRATFPGAVYQLGNLLASDNATLQAGIGARMGDDYSWAPTEVAGVVAVVIAMLAGFSTEARDVRMGGGVHGKGASPPR